MYCAAQYLCSSAPEVSTFTLLYSRRQTLPSAPERQLLEKGIVSAISVIELPCYSLMMNITPPCSPLYEKNVSNDICFVAAKAQHSSSFPTDPYGVLFDL